EALALVRVVRLPDSMEAVEDEDGSSRPQAEGAGRDVGRGPGIAGRGHPAGHEAAPDQLVKPELVSRHVAAEVLRAAVGIGRADRFVGVLGPRPRLLLPPLPQVALAQAGADPAADAFFGFLGDP